MTKKSSSQSIEASVNYTGLKNGIGVLLLNSRKNAARQVNQILIDTYWQIGKYIVDFEQGGEGRAAYGEGLISKLSKDLTLEFGRGFSRTNLKNFRSFYILFQIGQTPSDDSVKTVTLSGQLQKGQTVSDLLIPSSILSYKLSWSHYVELIKIDQELERSFYIKQCEKENWSVRELKRQMKSMLFHRLALSKDKNQIITLANKGATIQKAEDLIKDPYVFEFLGLPQQKTFHESELEERLILNLENFLLELGKGFAFIGRQYKITIGSRHFYIDLVFYHRILKCFVLIDLKRGEVEHNDIGQMNLYLNYFQKDENQEDDNPPIGLVLGAYKDHILMEYATANLDNQLFVSKYQLYLPDKEELKQELEKLLT